MYVPHEGYICTQSRTVDTSFENPPVQHCRPPFYVRAYLRGSGRGRPDFLFLFLLLPLILAFRGGSGSRSFGVFSFGVIRGVCLGFGPRRFFPLFSLLVSPGDACRSVEKK